MEEAYLGVDIGSISTKGVIIDKNYKILASEYIWTDGDTMGAARNLTKLLETHFAKEKYKIVATGTTGSARKLVGAMLGATMVKNEITAHAVGTTTLYPDVRTILEIGGQDSKIILVENGVAVDYAMNTLCAAGTGSFLSSQAKRLGVEVEDFGKIALTSKHPTQLAARCTVFAESDLVHKIQMGHTKEDIIAGLCRSVVNNYLNNVGKGKKIVSPVVFQGGVSKNIGVVEALRRRWAAISSWMRTDISWVPSVLRFWQERAIRRKSLISLLKIWYLRQERLTADAVQIIARSSVYTEMTC